jgi:hypothetical protein
MTDDAAYHRTFKVLPDRYVVYYDARTDAFQSADAVRAFHFSAAGLGPVIVLKNKGQEFAKFATVWEQFRLAKHPKREIIRVNSGAALAAPAGEGRRRRLWPEEVTRGLKRVPVGM